MANRVYDHNAAYDRSGAAPEGRIPQLTFGFHVKRGAMWGDYTELYKVSWQGFLGDASDEIFDYSRWVVGTIETNAAGIADAYSTDVTDLLAESTTGSTPFSNIGQIFPTHVHWTKLSVWRYVEGTGHWDGITPREDRELTDNGLGSTGNGMPFQNAFCMTVRTDMPSRRRRNRWYLPPTVNNATDGKGRMLGSLVDDIQTQFDLANTAHIATDNASQAVYSPTDHVARQPVDWYSGEEYDTQRRRRNKLVEVRHVLLVTG